MHRLRPLSSNAIEFIPRNYRNPVNLDVLMCRIRDKNMFWETTQIGRRVYGPIRQMIRGILKKSYAHLKRKERCVLTLRRIIVHDWDSDLAVYDANIDEINGTLGVAAFLNAMISYSSVEDRTPEMINFISKVAGRTTLVHVKLIYFHPLLQEIEELFHFPIKAYQHIRSVPHWQGQDWTISYEMGTIRITDNDVKDSITARSYDLRQDRTIDGTSVLLRGYPEVETLCDNSYQNNNSHIYKSEELRFL